MKYKREAINPWNSFCLKITILDVYDMPHGCLNNWVTP